VTWGGMGVDGWMDGWKDGRVYGWMDVSYRVVSYRISSEGVRRRLEMWWMWWMWWM
jgi:hypothetical protein